MSSPGTGWKEAIRLRAGLIAAAVLLVTLLCVSTVAPKRSQDADYMPRTTIAWRLLGVYPLSESFGDLRSVTHRWPCVRAGADSYTDDKCDPWGRPFNYPPIWLAPARLGLGPSSTPWLGLIEAGLLFLSLWTLFPARTVKGSAVVAAVALSPPVMFAVERGNVDLLLFAGLVLGLRATRDLSAARRDGVRSLLFAALAFLKLFPVAAFIAIARSPRRVVWAVGAGAVTCAALAFAYREALPILQANTMHEFDSNYGRLALFAADPAASAWRSPQAITSLIFSGLVGGLGAVVGLVYRTRVLTAFGDLLSGDYVCDLAVTASALFGLTFLIGLNYDYRLIFLLPVLPLLFLKDGGTWSTPSGAAAAFVIVRMLLAHRVPDFWLGVADWVIFAGASAWLTASAAARLRAMKPAPAYEAPPAMLRA